MKIRFVILLLLAGIVTGCAKPQTMTITLRCDLSVDGVCFMRTDGKDHIAPFTPADEAKVDKALSRTCQGQISFIDKLGAETAPSVTQRDKDDSASYLIPKGAKKVRLYLNTGDHP